MQYWPPMISDARQTTALVGLQSSPSQQAAKHALAETHVSLTLQWALAVVAARANISNKKKKNGRD